MQNEWILEVLADLREFASHNGLPALADYLDDTRLVAAEEIASQAGGKRADEFGHATAAGTDLEVFGAGR